MFHFENFIGEAVTAWNTRTEPVARKLTLEEIKELEGKPIWIEKTKGEKAWYIVPKVVDWVNYVFFDERCYFDGYGKTWIAYDKQSKGE